MALSIFGTSLFSAGGIFNQLDRAQKDVATRSSRISSGLQVGGFGNSANSSLIGITQSLLSQAQGAMAALGNVGQGIDLVQTAEGGLSQTSDLLQRARELAVQSANGTLSDQDRTGLQKEFAQIQQQIDQVANGTQFNGKQLLNGTTPSATLQTGGSAGNQLTVPLPNATTNALGVNGLAIDTQAGATAAISQLDTAMSQVSGNRADLGALQNRLESTVQTLTSSQVNLEASHSQIANADLAAELTGLVTANLRQNTNAALLAQSNLSSRSVLRLFGQAG